MSIDKVKVSKLPQLLSVRVKNPESVIFEGKAVAITSVNKEGVFDIIAYHTNFISILKDFVTIQQSKDKKLTIPIQGGIMKVYGNNVYIYLGIKTSE